MVSWKKTMVALPAFAVLTYLCAGCSKKKKKSWIFPKPGMTADGTIYFGAEGAIYAIGE